MSEYSSVQKPILTYASQLGWQFISRQEAEKLRGFDFQVLTTKDKAGNASLFFDDVLYQKVKEFNPKFSDSKDSLIRQISILQNDIAGNRDSLLYLRGKKTFYCQEETRELNLKLIDFDHSENNTYQITEEFYYHNGRYGNRADIVFLINGIPVVIVEDKNPSLEEAIPIGIDQLRRYHNETPEMMIPQQVFSAVDGLGFSYGGTWNLSRRSIFNWKDEEVGNLENKVKTFFAKEHILDYIQNYILFVEKDEELKKFILAQHQVNAVKLVIERSHNDAKHRGLIWHTQGSGKTYTMIKAAEILFKSNVVDKPTILLLIDRSELEDQLIRNLKSLCIDFVEQADSIKDLRDLLKTDYRGLIVSTIHKFQEMPANICERKNIFVFVDEAHRTTQGDLGNYLMAAIPQATFIGFTGTPIDLTAHGKGTFKTFGIDDKSGYLHKYSIADSIKDKTTLPLFYSLAPNELLVPKEILEQEFLKLKEAEGITDIEELNKLLEKAVKTKNFLKGDKRVDKVAKLVSEHYKQTVLPMGYKAFLVGVDRQACALYKKALDKYLPSEYSTVVYTSAHNDSKELKEYYLTEEEEKKIRKEFTKLETLPKILIVTEKLLTGYDAEILYAMYLDKPMRDHTLLQAIARVNRPYVNEVKEMEKPHGFILDFIGIFEKLEKALAFDSKDVHAVINDIALLKNLFKDKMEQTASQYLNLAYFPFTDKDIDGLIEYFRDKRRRKEFFDFFKQIKSLYEIISPDAFLRPYVKDYNKLAEMFAIVRKAFTKQINVDKEVLRKTIKMIRENVDIYQDESTFEEFNIDEEALKKIADKNKKPNIRIINLVKSIQKYVSDNPEDISLIPFSQRALAIEERYEQRQDETQATIDALSRLLEEELKRKKEHDAKGFDGLAGFIYSVVIDKTIKNVDDTTKKLRQKFSDFANWKTSGQERRDLRQELYYVLNAVEDDIDKCVAFVDYLFSQLEKAYKL